MHSVAIDSLQDVLNFVAAFAYSKIHIYTLYHRNPVQLKNKMYVTCIFFVIIPTTPVCVLLILTFFCKLLGLIITL